MSADSGEPDKPRARGSGCLVGCLAVLVVGGLMVLLVCGGLLLRSRQAANQVEAELARLRAAGEPTTPAELHAYYAKPPVGQDTTALWLEAIAPLDTPAFQADCGELPVVGTGKNPVPPPGRPWPELPAVEQFLAKYAGSLNKMHLAAERGGAARYPVRFEDDLAMRLPHCIQLRNGARLLTLEVHVRAHRADPHGTAQSIETILAAGDSLRLEPVLVSQLVRIALGGMAKGALETQLPAASFSPEDLARLQERFQKTNYDEGIERAMVGERIMGCMVIDNLAEADASDGPSPIMRPLLAPLRNQNRQSFLEWSGRIVAAAGQPLPERLDEADALQAELDRIARDANYLTKASHLAVALMLPATKAGFTAGARGNAEMQLAAVAIAAQRFRQKHGKLPENLKQLVPEFLGEVPADPFDGRSLRYVVRGEEAVLYSVGPNRRDDRGKTAEDPNEGDMIFTLRPPRRPGKPAK